MIIDEAVRPPMAKLGFRRRGRVFRLDLEADWEAWVRLVVTREPGSALLLREEIAVLYLPWAEWWEGHFSYRPDMTLQLRDESIGVNRSWRGSELCTDEQAEQYSNEFVAMARDVAQPWLRQAATLDALMDRGSWPLHGGHGKCLEQAVAAAIVGEREAATRLLLETIDAIDDQFPEFADRVRSNVSMVADSFGLEVEVPLADPDRPARAQGTIPIHTTPATIRLDLYHYGEDELAERARHLTSDEADLIAQAAGRWAFDQGVLLLAKAVALAAVEVLEGEPRDLALSRRRPLDSRPPA